MTTSELLKLDIYYNSVRREIAAEYAINEIIKKLWK